MKKNNNKSDNNSKLEIEELENRLAEEYAKEYFDKIKENVGNIECEDGGINSGRLWDLKKNIFPKSREPPTAMKHPQTGNILTTDDKINEVAVDCFSERLECAPIKKELEHIKDAKEILCDKLIKVAQTNRTPPWTMRDLNIVLKNLKKQKSRDPYGLANDIFRPEVAGEDLKLAILKLMNKIKEEQIYPKCLELCNISSLWKRKGNRNDFENYRGIFRVTIFRSILDRIIIHSASADASADLSAEKLKILLKHSRML